MAADKNEASLTASFLLHLSEALDDGDIIKKFRTIMSPLMTPVMDALNQANATIDFFKKRMDEKDNKIAALEQNISEMDLRLDDLEQQGRRGSMRVFGIPEDTPGSVDAKVLALCNGQMGMSPLLVLEDLEVVHRLGKPSPGTQNADVPAPAAPARDSRPASLANSEPHEAPAVPGPEHQLPHQPTQPRPAPRPILVKFASRRTKGRVMGCKKELKSNPCTRLDGTLSPVYVSDDLTKRRATLAIQARTLKRAGTVADAWTFDSKIYIKHNYNRIHPIAKEEDFRKFQRN